MAWAGGHARQPSTEHPPLYVLQLSFVCAQMPMLFFLNNYLYQLNHTLFGVKHCGERTGAGWHGGVWCGMTRWHGDHPGWG